ncbi:MAG: YybH family protein [Gemmatimonadota bacterium]
MRIRTTAAALAALLAAAPGLHAQEDVLAGLRSSYAAHYNMGHADVVADLYTADAVVMAADGHVYEGRDAIRESLAAAMAEASPKLEITSHQVQTAGDWAFGRGSYTVTLNPAGGEAMTETGHYVVVCRKQSDGSWKLAWAIANSATTEGM